MGVSYDPTPTEGREEFDFNDQEAIVKCVGFSRNQDGVLVVKDRLGYGLQQVGEQIVDTLNDDAIVREGDAWERVVYYQFEIVSYQEKDKTLGREHLGKTLPYTSKLKGITTYQDDDGKWWFKMPGLAPHDAKFRTGLFVVAEKCGFDVQALNPDSALYSPEYIAAEMGSLEAPMTPEQVVEKIIEPKLLAAADAGLLLKVHTNERSNWVQYGSIAPLTAEQADRYHQAQVSEDAKAEELRNTLRGMAKGASPDFAAQVYKLALQVQPDVDKDNVLATSSAATLEFVVAQLSEPEPTAEPSL